MDNRFIKKTIKRVIEVQTIGYLEQGKFTSGASFLPMIGNICSIPTKEELNQIYINNYISNNNTYTIPIGQSLNEGIEVSLPVNLFFASHIGIFGNTGSGKSNTLHKLYYELFTTNNYPNFKTTSSFLVLDFNGEYVHENSFGIKTDGKEKKVHKLTSKVEHTDKIQIKYDTFFDDEMLSILFSATQQTQKPFITRLLRKTKKYKEIETSLSNWIIYLIKQIFTGIPNPNIRDYLIDVLEKYIDGIDEYLNIIKQTEIFSKDNKICFFLKGTSPSNSIFIDGSHNDLNFLRLDEIEEHINNLSINIYKEFELRCHLQLVNDLLFGNVREKHITPLLARIV